MKELLETIIKNLVDKPDEVEISETTNAKSIICYEVKVAKADMGKVIGKNGKIINKGRKEKEKSKEIEVLIS